MKASFDGARKNLARSFNNLVGTNLDEDQKAKMQDLRNCVVGLLCMYDPDNPEDRNELIDEVKLEEIA